MVELLIVSLIWAFSFSLIKDNLVSVDPNFVAFARLFVSLLVFLPFLRLKDLSRQVSWQLMIVGGIQYGLMYIAYNLSFHYLQAYEVALFTILTPFYVTLIDNLAQRHFSWLHGVTTLLAVTGAAVVKLTGAVQNDIFLGFMIVQVSNLSFAFGQIYYKRIMATSPQLSDRRVFALPYLGAVLLTALSTTLFGGWASLQLGSKQIFSLIYLGVIASGLGFFLWNSGARKVNNGALAIFNNLKIPLAVAVSLLVFGESTNVPNLVAGALLMIIAIGLNEFFGNLPKLKTQRVL
ncbi:MAG TPA: EamA family transporter [Anaerolineaceae bacterium]|nr:EamA family transporter [Anaerolineaceae bacterium]